MSHSLVLAAASTVVLATAAILTSTSAPALASTWRAQILFSAPTKLSGCAIGDLDATIPGNEIAAVGEEGNVFVIQHGPTLPVTEHEAKGPDDWAGAEVFRAPGELIQCAIGEADPACAGNEIVAVGKAIGAEHDPGEGAVYLLTRRGAGYVGEIIAKSPKLMHGVCIVSGQIIVTGYDQNLMRFTRSGAAWARETLIELPGNGKTCVPLGEDFIVASTDGSLVRARKNATGFAAEVIDKRDRARSRVGTDGSRILCSDDDGTLTLFDGATKTVLLSGSMLKQRGAVFADLDPARPGLEFGTAGYDRRIRVLWQNADTIEQVAPYVDDERFHHSCAGNLDADAADEMICASFSGHIVLVESVAAQ